MTKTANRSVGRAFRIIDEFAESAPKGVSELAKRLDLPVSTAYDYLQSLVDTGYVSKEENGYRPTTQFL